MCSFQLSNHMNAELITKLSDAASDIVECARAVHKDVIQSSDLAELLVYDILQEAVELKRKINRFTVAASHEDNL